MGESHNLMKKSLLILTLIFLMGGIGIRIQNVILSCENITRKYILNDPNITRYRAIYFIKNVNNFCRPCSEYDKIKNKMTKVLFLVESNFTDNDINNFRDIFSILDNHVINKLDKKIENKLEKCLNKKATNYFIELSERGKIERLKAF